MLEEGWTRQLEVLPAHLALMRRGLAIHRLPHPSFHVDGVCIDEVIERSGDSYIWHRSAGTAYGESALLQERMREGEIHPDSRLAHGAIGLIHALRAAFAQGAGMPVRGIRDVRYAVPVFEGARLSAMIEPPYADEGGFAVATDQLEPRLAITGRIEYGPVVQGSDVGQFISPAEQQLFTLEEAVGLLSALIGLGVEESGARVLYMRQWLEVLYLISPGDVLQATATLVEREAGRRTGERVTVGVDVRSKRHGAVVAAGESTFLYMVNAAS